MVNFLVRLFVKNSEQTHLPEVRSRYGVLSGGVGIALNLCLFAAKFLAGLLASSIAITADAFNNLSDAGSSVVTLVGFRMACAPADSEHPFGHGRIEYVSGLAVSVAILLVGVELGKSSVEKILHPEAIQFSTLSMGILAVSVAVKLWMCWFNRSLGNRIGSTAMRATAMDSLTDAVATAAVSAGTVIGHLSGLLLDGWIGLLVAAFILYTGYHTAKDSLSPLLGQTPDPEFVEQIAQTVMKHDEVIGMHDLIVHDYGPGRRMISLHAEMPCTMDVLVMHDATDLLELELRHKFNCEVTIHMDPIEVNNQAITEMRKRLIELVQGIDPVLSIHDFRMVWGKSHTNLIFDLLVPYQFSMTNAEVSKLVQERVRQMEDGQYFAVVKVEQAFV